MPISKVDGLKRGNGGIYPQSEGQGELSGLLSNINYGVLEYIEKEMEWLEVFDHKVYSCDLLSLKPELRIYESAIEKVGMNPEECLFIDDAQENIDGAKAAGMEGIRFESTKAMIDQVERLYELVQ